MGADELAKHLAECRGVAAAVVADGDATAVVHQMLADGWTYHGEEVVEGKRVRYLVPPPEIAAVIAGDGAPRTCECDGAGRHMRGPNCVTPAGGGEPARGRRPGQHLAAGAGLAGVADYGQPLTDFERRAGVVPTYGVLDNGCPEHGYRQADGCPECALRVHRIALTTSPEEDPA